MEKETYCRTVLKMYYENKFDLPTLHNLLLRAFNNDIVKAYNWLYEHDKEYNK